MAAHGLIRAREGSALALVAVMMVALLAIVALAVDLGMAYSAHSEAQRTADAAALAAASAFRDLIDVAEAVPEAERRAYEYVARNPIHRQQIDSAQDVNVEIVPEQELVRVWVQRRGLPTWFARFLGIDQMTVNAAAVAQARPAGAAKCLKPWALMDLWHEADSDANGNRWWDEDEVWEYDPTAGDKYAPTTEIGENETADPDGATGYGSGYRNTAPGTTAENDWGRQISIKAADPNSEYVPNPGTFLPWRVGADDSGADDYRDNIVNCNQETIYLTDYDDATDHDQYPIETGNMVGPTFQGVRDLMEQDIGATWDPTGGPDGQGAVVGSEYGNWMDSPRVIKVAVMSPDQLVSSGMQEIEFNNFALLFLEGQSGMHDDVTARFLFYVEGTGSVHTTAGPLVKVIQLIG